MNRDHSVKPSRPGAYLRISDDALALGEGVARQREDVLALAERLGWPVPEFYVDNDVSAFKANVIRPEWCRLLEDIRSGEVDGFLAYNLDRVVRQPRDLEDLIELVEGKIPTHAATGLLDLSNDAGVTVARLMVSFANLESRSIARRVKRKHAELASLGRVSGGQRPYGFEDDRVTHRPSEAAIVSEAAYRVLHGEPLYSIVNDLNDRGLRPARGREWRVTGLRIVLRAARTGGYREHEGNLVEAVWAPLIPREVWLEVRAIIEARQLPGGARARRWLLTGFVVCGECHAQMIVKSVHGVPRYGCPVKRGGGCGGPSRRADHLEELVETFVFRWLEEAKLEAPAVADPAAETLERLQAKLATMDKLYAEGEIEDLDYFRHLKALREEMKQAAAGVRRAQPRPTTGDDPRADWSTMTLGERRAVIASVVEVVKVYRVRNPSGHRKTLELETVELVPR